MGPKTTWAARLERLAVGAASTAMANVACGPSGSPPGGGEHGSSDGGDIVGCDSFPGVSGYAPDTTTRGEASVFTFVLVSASPVPPAVGLNTWVLQVLDGSGNRISGASLTSVVPFMPTMGHGTVLTPQVTPNADGGFTISEIYLFMPGIWRTTVVAEVGPMKDSAAFTFCIPG